MKRATIHKEKIKIVKAMTKCFKIALTIALFIEGPTMLFAQNHKLVIQNGAAFGGSGMITVKDSIRNSNASSPTSIVGKVILSGADQGIVNNGVNSSLVFEALSLRGSGIKTIAGAIAVSDSLNIISGTTLNIQNDTLRIGNIIAGSGTITSNANTVIEYSGSNGSTQSVLGGTFPCKIRLMNNTQKNILGALTVDSLEHSGWGLTINNNLAVNGKALIDTLVNVTNGVILSVGINNNTIAVLRGNDGIIQANSGGSLVFMNAAQNGNGTIRTNDGTVSFNGDISGTGTLAVTGNGTMKFSGTVSSANYSFAQGSTVNYNGGNQTVVNTSYGNLSLTNPGVKLFSAGTTGIAGSITLAGGAAADAITNSATIDYNGTGAQTIGALDYYNLSLSNSHGNQQITLVNGGTIKVSGVFTNSAANAVFVNTDNTFEYNGTSAQTITPFTYYNLVLSGGGSKVVGASQTANGNVAQQSGTALTINNGVVWQIDGLLATGQDFINNGEVVIGN